jgi:hypothetical protein
MEQNVGRGVAFAALTLYWIAYALTTQFVVSFPEFGEPFWDSAAPLLVGIALAFVVGLYIGEWWALSAAVSPLIPLAMLQASDHIAPYGDETAPLAGWQWWLAATAIPLVIGVGLRKGLGPRPRRSPRTHDRRSRVSEG